MLHGRLSAALANAATDSVQQCKLAGVVFNAIQGEYGPTFLGGAQALGKAIGGLYGTKAARSIRWLCCLTPGVLRD